MATGIENLKIWKLAHSLEIKVYELTKNFPEEAFILKRVNQVRRASSSVADNIAESYGKYSYGNKIHSMYISRGEAEEVKSQFVSFLGHKYIEEKIILSFIKKYTELIKGINGYIRFLRKKQQEKLSNQATKQLIN